MKTLSKILIFWCSSCFAWELVPADGATLLDLGFESEPAGTLLNDAPGWIQLTESTGSGRLQYADESGGNQFLTTQLGSNDAGRYALGFANPGFSSSTTLTLSMDVWDPLVNPQSGLNTFPRAVAGIFELNGTEGIPPYVGLEQLSLGQNDIAEWVVAEENFVNRQQGAVDAVAQDTWYTIESVWDFSAGTKNLSVKTRDGADPFVKVLPPSPIGFADPSQHLGDLNSLAVRMLRGTRIDNIKVQYEDPGILPPEALIDIAQPRANVPGAPQPSDVQFSGRFVRPDTLSTMQAFQATRNDWTFSTNPAWIQTIVDEGISFGGGQGATAFPRDQAALEGWAAIDWQGNLLTKPRFRDNGWWYGDMNDSRFRDAIMNRLRPVIDGGGTRMHFDDPPWNPEMVLLDDDPNLGLQEGVYNEASVLEFRNYLQLNTTVAERSQWSIPADFSGFDYRQYVADRSGVVDPSLHDHWIEFHFQSAERFYDDLQAEISDYAGFFVPFSANNFKDGDLRWDDDHELTRIYGRFDWAIGELIESRANPFDLRRVTRQAEELGKRQTYTLRSTDVDLNRKVIAYTYALGTHMVAPWDVYLGGNTGQGDRFFGDPNDYVDLFGFVLNHAELYDGYESAADVGPGIVDSRIAAWDPIIISGGSGEVYANARAVPDDPVAPVVIHLVDWSDSPLGFTLQLRNEMFQWPVSIVMPAELLLPDGSELALTGTVDESGYTELSVSALEPYGLLVVEAYPLTADFDMDGDVDHFDLATWETGFGTSTGATKAMGDSDNDGDVDGYDFLNWQRQVGQSFNTLTTLATVPEPSSLLLTLIAATLSWWRRGNTRRP